MKIVLAQLVKDIRCQRTPLILWIVCLGLAVVPYALTVALKHADQSGLNPSHLSETQVLVGVVSYIAILMACITAAGFGMVLLLPIIVTRVVHDDPLMGTTAFWQTRPIPRPQLMLAKALFIGVLITPLMVAMSNGGKIGDDKFWPAIAGFIAAVAAVAAVTPGTTAWFGYAAALLFGKLIFSGIIDALWSHYHGPGALFSDDALHPLIETGQFLHLNGADFLHLCYFVGFSLVFVHQYLTLRTRRSLLLFILTLGTVGVLQMISGPTPGDSHAVIQFNSSSSTGPTH
ncbi:MAG TPA: hypothetical protein VK961_15900 [Chthoniobacter sp.]|nr:hypothetical protein [Chthoniobacter sp.]